MTQSTVCRVTHFGGHMLRGARFDSNSTFRAPPAMTLRKFRTRIGLTHVLLPVSKEELAKLVQGFEKQDILTSSGVTLAGNRYIPFRHGARH
jgi:hypothetical protein